MIPPSDQERLDKVGVLLKMHGISAVVFHSGTITHFPFCITQIYNDSSIGSTSRFSDVTSLENGAAEMMKRKLDF